MPAKTCPTTSQRSCSMILLPSVHIPGREFTYQCPSPLRVPIFFINQNQYPSDLSLKVSIDILGSDIVNSYQVDFSFLLEQFSSWRLPFGPQASHPGSCILNNEQSIMSCSVLLNLENVHPCLKWIG